MNMYNRSAYTLIELLVTITVIGVLASIAVSQFGKARQTARNSFAKTTISDAGKSIEAFRNQERAGGRVIAVGIDDTHNTIDPAMNCSGLASIKGSVGGDTVSSGSGHADIRNYFTGIENIDKNAPSYGFNISKSLSNDYSFYYGTSSVITSTGSPHSCLNTSDSMKGLTSLEGTFTTMAGTFKHCYVIQSDLNDLSSPAIRHISVINGKYYEHSNANCKTPGN